MNFERVIEQIAKDALKEANSDWDEEIACVIRGIAQRLETAVLAYRAAREDAFEEMRQLERASVREMANGAPLNPLVD